MTDFKMGDYVKIGEQDTSIGKVMLVDGTDGVGIRWQYGTVDYWYRNDYLRDAGVYVIKLNDLEKAMLGL